MSSFSHAPTFNDVLACSAPLVFTDPDGENPFFGGTCFRVNFAGGMYVVTARHCIKNSNVDLETTRVECAMTERIYFPLSAWHLFGTKLADTDHSDIAIFQADTNRMSPADRRHIPALEVTACPLPKDFETGYRLMVEGFSSRLGQIDYDERRWIRGSEKLEARYNGPSQTEVGTSQLTFIIDAEKAKDLDGLSGAPVFAFKQVGAAGFDVGFAGMMIRARYFVNAEIVVQALEHVVAKSQTALQLHH